MNDISNTLLQWLHRIGLHPDRSHMEHTSTVLRHTGEAVSQTANQAIHYMDMPSLLALAAALGWASGFRLYVVVFLVGLLGSTGLMELPGSLYVLEHPAMLFASGGLLFVEFFADKIPGLDSIWDLLQSVLRIPAGAALAAGVFGADDTTMATVAALMGGTLAATSQAAKTTTRALINTSPEPFSNVGASLAEDSAAIAALWLALANPVVFAAVLVLTVLMMWLTTWWLWRFLKLAIRKLRSWM